MDTVRIKFKHIQDVEDLDVITNGKHNVVAVTVCDLQQRTADGQWALLATGEAWCKAPDNFSKEIGRRKSLARAIAVLYPYPEKGGWRVLENRETYLQRATLWDLYFSRDAGRHDPR